MTDVKQPMLDWLREIVAQESLNEEELSDWANEWLAVSYHDDYHEQTEREMYQAHEHGLLQMSALRPQVVPYRNDPALPTLPDKPHGQLHGIGFIYDEDRDDRVLVAIGQLKNTPGLIALAEHEGSLRIYTRSPIDLSSINVCGDEWVVEEFVPYRSRWTEVTNTFMRKCVAQVLEEQK
jgi:hypothetical protein